MRRWGHFALKTIPATYSSLDGSIGIYFSCLYQQILRDMAEREGSLLLPCGRVRMNPRGFESSCLIKIKKPMLSFA